MPSFQGLKLKYEEPVSNFAFNFNLRPYMMEMGQTNEISLAIEIASRQGLACIARHVIDTQVKPSTSMSCHVVASNICQAHRSPRRRHRHAFRTLVRELPVIL